MSKLAIGEGGICNDSRREFIYWYMSEYIERGGNCLDTARIYGGGESEYYVGKFIKNYNRDRITLVTKCAHHDINVKNSVARLSPPELRGDLETSLKKLDTDYTDVLLLHRDHIKTPVFEIMPTLDSFVREGKVKIIGTSNWTAGRIEEANKFAAENNLTQFSVSQIQWSLAMTTPAQSGDTTHVIMDEAEYSWYSEKKFPVMAWSASAKGFFSKYAAGAEINPHIMQRYGWLNENHVRAERAKKTAAALGIPVGTLVLAFIMCDEVPGCAITSFSNKTQFEEAMLADTFTISTEIIKELRKPLY